MDMKWATQSFLDSSDKTHSGSSDQQNGYRESGFNIESEEDLLTSPLPAPNIHVFHVPLIGRMQYVQDIAGYIQWSVILLYWIYGNWSTWLLILLPHYNDGQMSVLMLFIYAGASALCLLSFIQASTSNPGTLINGQQPQDDWQICGKCCRRRPPMAHHCRRCGQCVRKMDHHCPWINNCVGEDNQFAFMLLLAYAYILSLTTLILDILHMNFMPHCVTCDKESFMMRHESAIIWTAIVMAIMMTCGAAGLYMSQHISILFETPSIEWMNIQQAYFTAGPAAIKWPTQKRSVFGAYRATFGEGSWLLWPFPCRRRRFSSLYSHV